MKKVVCLVFVFIFFCILATGVKAQSCGDGGTCMPGSSRVCPSGQQYLGLYNCLDSAPNCCKASSASGAGVSPAGGGNQSAGFGNPLGNTNSIDAVLTNIMGYLRGIAGTIAVIFIIIGGIMYMVSGGSKETTERAKKTLICAIAGLAIVLAAPLFLQEIKAVLTPGSNPGSALQQVLMNILKLLLSIVGFLAIISMVVGGIWMLTAVGDEDRYELGKKTAGYSILGLVIALSALIIANQVTSLLGGSSSGSMGSNVINNAANSPATGAAVPSLPGTTPTDLSSTNYTLVGINGQTDVYMYKDDQGNFYEKSDNGTFTPGSKNDVVPVTMLGTLVRTNNTVMRDTYGNYYEAGGSSPVPLKLQDGDKINYFPSK